MRHYPGERWTAIRDEAQTQAVTPRGFDVTEALKQVAFAEQRRGSADMRQVLKAKLVLVYLTVQSRGADRRRSRRRRGVVRAAGTAEVG